MRQESTIRSIKLVAIDLAKRCYQLGAIDEQGKILYNRKGSPHLLQARHWTVPSIRAIEHAWV
jgi:hypothetical protein